MYSKYLGNIEYWKDVNFNVDFEYTNTVKLQVSNFGRLKTVHSATNGNIIKGGNVEGYNVYKTKLMLPRDSKLQHKLDILKAQALKQEKKIWALKREKASNATINEATALWANMRKNITKEIAVTNKKRVVNISFLTHRLVALYFLAKPKPNQIFVAHLDYNKNNNTAANLRWMTKEENIAHQQKSPAVIARKNSPAGKLNNAKLSVPKVMLIKKGLNQNKSSKLLAKQFEVSDMQIHRIKIGENWSKIPAAE